MPVANAADTKIVDASKSKRAVDGTVHAVEQKAKIGGIFTPTEDAAFLKERLAFWDKLYTKQQEIAKSKPGKPIKIKLPDGRVVDGTSGQTTPMEIAKGINKKLSEKSLVAKIGYEDENPDASLANFAMNDEDATYSKGAASTVLWDLMRPLEGDCSLELLQFDDPDGKIVFWHSSAHILGEALELLYGAQLTVGPPLTNGFYYDSYVGDMSFSEEFYRTLIAKSEKIAKENQEFERLLCTKEEALELFKHNPFKRQLISSKIPDGTNTTCYRCGTLIDLCRGPHIPSTGKVAAFSVTKHSSAYWLGDSKLDSLQRIYGISFPDKKQLAEYNHFLMEAKKRDHRLLGNTLNLYFFDTNVAAGSTFWLPHGARLYNKLCNFLKREYNLRGFEEVISPNLYSVELWKTSGHYYNYKENMFMLDVEEKEWGLKPMNCPGHCVMFKHISPSYRQLPIRFADFGVLHRNELSGSLSGLTRVRRFQQDDGHIFCTLEQVASEVLAALDFVFFVYDKFGFNYELKLSTRPEKALGDLKLWNTAEDALKEALTSTGKAWSINEGDGAFYGPKIDLYLLDALNRKHQCGTVQLDFQLPLRFNLQYQDAESKVSTNTEEKHEVEVGDSNAVVTAGEQSSSTSGVGFNSELTSSNALKPGMGRPVMIHRAIFGSIERFVGVLVEHTAGKFPFWISPRQAIVLPINGRNNEYAFWLRNTLRNFTFDVSVDESNNTINKKIRTAQLQQWNYLLVVGDREEADGTVTVRDRDAPNDQVTIPIQELLSKLEERNDANSKPAKNFIPWKGASK